MHALRLDAGFITVLFTANTGPPFEVMEHTINTAPGAGLLVSDGDMLRASEHG